MDHELSAGFCRYYLCSEGLIIRLGTNSALLKATNSMWPTQEKAIANVNQFLVVQSLHKTTLEGSLNNLLPQIGNDHLHIDLRRTVNNLGWSIHHIICDRNI